MWPILNNEYFKDELIKAKSGENPNNISPIIEYSLKDGAIILWMGDLETDFMENIKGKLNLTKVNILFAPLSWASTLWKPSDRTIGCNESRNYNYWRSKL